MMCSRSDCSTGPAVFVLSCISFSSSFDYVLAPRCRGPATSVTAVLTHPSGLVSDGTAPSSAVIFAAGLELARSRRLVFLQWEIAAAFSRLRCPRVFSARTIGRWGRRSEIVGSILKRVAINHYDDYLAHARGTVRVPGRGNPEIGSRSKDQRRSKSSSAGWRARMSRPSG